MVVPKLVVPGMSGITKREPPISWRPSKEARLALARLLERAGSKRNEILNRLVISAARLAWTEDGLPPGRAEAIRAKRAAAEDLGPPSVALPGKTKRVESPPLDAKSLDARASLDRVKMADRTVGAMRGAKLKNYQRAMGGMKRIETVPEPDWKKDAPVSRGETRTLTGRAHGSVPKGKK